MNTRMTTACEYPCVTRSNARETKKFDFLRVSPLNAGNPCAFKPIDSPMSTLEQSREPAAAPDVASLQTDDFQAQPYWWDNSPLSDRSLAELPDTCDVAIVGSGYTGLCAALELAANGRQVVVIDAGDPGHGCSTRNGGQISSSIKPGYAQLSKRYGPELAAAIMNAGHNGLFWIEDFINQHGIECDFKRCGRFYGAHTKRVFDSLERKLDDQPPGVELNAEVIPQHEQQRFIDSDSYHGGLFYKDHCSLDPGRYHRGMLERAEALGVEVVGRAKVTAVTPTGTKNGASQNQFRLETTRGELQAQNTIVATNGYSDALMPWTRRLRLVYLGIGS